MTEAMRQQIVEAVRQGGWFINWGDWTIEPLTSTDLRHQYTTAGEYTVFIFRK